MILRKFQVSFGLESIFSNYVFTVFGFEQDLSLELMEIPLSPTHYDAPPTPDHEPPSAFEAELSIQSVIDKIRNVRIILQKS
jgi:hypothetical protein